MLIIAIVIAPQSLTHRGTEKPLVSMSPASLPAFGGMMPDMLLLFRVSPSLLGISNQPVSQVSSSFVSLARYL